MGDRGRCTPQSILALFASCILIGASVDATARDDDVRYTIRPGDTLIGIANTQLADPSRWRDIKELNRVRNDRRLQPGATLRIPAEWLRHTEAGAVVEQVEGDTRIDGRAAKAGERLSHGVRVETGERGSVALRFADGGVTVVQPQSAVQLDMLRTLPGSGAARTRLRLDAGRIENTVVPQRKPGALFEVQTPAAVAGVRGTRYRVGDLQGDALTEVLEGEVRVGTGRSMTSHVDVKSGYGVRVAAGGEVAAPVALLAPPDLSTLPALQARPLVRLRIPPVTGADRYRAQVAPNASFHTVLQETVFTGEEMRFAGLPDGEYALRVRAIDARGLEGIDSVRAFRLKARPEPPFASAPADRSKVRGERVQFRWAAAAQAERYALQIAADPGFASIVHEAAELRATGYTPDRAFAPGRYFWRLASVRGDADQGPWGDPASFELLPAPAAPEAPTIDNERLMLRWSAEPGQRFLLQMARDPRFEQMHAERTLEAPTIELRRPPAGAYYVRVQATDPDGFVGPFTDTQRIDVPEPPPSPWLFLLLLPLLGAF
jgi:hypothetical protein